MHLTDHQWTLLQPIFSTPERKPSKSEAVVEGRRGRPSYPDRLILDAILWKVRTGLPWYNLPAHYPAWQTCYNHYRKLRDAGILNQVYIILYRDLAPHLGFDLEDALSLGLLELKRRGRSLQLRVSFQEDDTWQASTLSLLLHVLVEKVRSNFSRRSS